MGATGGVVVGPVHVFCSVVTHPPGRARGSVATFLPGAAGAGGGLCSYVHQAGQQMLSDSVRTRRGLSPFKWSGGAMLLTDRMRNCDINIPAAGVGSRENDCASSLQLALLNKENRQLTPRRRLKLGGK